MNLSNQRPGAFLVLNLILFAVITGIDQAIKRWALQLEYPLEWLGIKVFAYENAGVFGGHLAELDPWIVRIFFSVLFGFLCLAGFLLLHFLAHKKAPILKWGILVYLAGLLGNVWDRMSRGAVVDYLIIPGWGDDELAFNFADIVVVTGFVLIAVSIFKEAHALWYERDQRRAFWVEPRFQKGFGALLVLVGFAHFFVIGLYSFVFLKVFVGGSIAPSGFDGDQVIFDYLVGLFILEGSGLLLTFAVSVLFSHRLVGPLIALEQFVRRLGQPSGRDEKPKFRLRQADYLRERVESIADRVVELQTSESASVKDQNPAE